MAATDGQSLSAAQIRATAAVDNFAGDEVLLIEAGPQTRVTSFSEYLCTECNRSSASTLRKSASSGCVGVVLVALAQM